MRPLLFLVFLSALATPSSAQIAAPQAADTLRSLFQHAHDDGLFNGVAVVKQDGEVVFEESFGAADAAQTRDLEVGDRFDVGSIAKELDAVGLMMLAERGVLRLDDRVRQFLPDLPTWADDIRVRDLLTYTTGLPDPVWSQIQNGGDLYRSLQSVDSLLFVPGTDYRYENVTVFVRRRVLEAAAGMPFDAFVRDVLAVECGMTQVVLDPEGDTPNHARAFDLEGVEDPFGPAPFSGWAHLTARDLAQWGECVHSETLLSHTWLARLADSFEGEDGSLGTLEVASGRVVRHSHVGSSRNFEALLYVDTESKTTIALVSNQKGFRLGPLSQAAVAILEGEPYDAPKRSIYHALRRQMMDTNVEEGLSFYHRLRDESGADYNLEDEEGDLNRTGYYLLGHDRLEAALAVFRLNVELYPLSANVHDSLGEALISARDREGALASYRRALALDPTSENARAAIARLESM